MGALHAAPNGGFRPIGPQGSGAGKARAAWLAGVLALAIAVLGGCDKTSPEERLKATIAQMEASGEAHEVSKVMDHVAEDFVGPGGMDRKQLHGFLTVASRRNTQLGVTIGPVAVALGGHRATAKFTLGATGGSGGLLPDRAQVYEMTTGWKLVDGEWMLISADWKGQL
jgi:hypothetical protein